MNRFGTVANITGAGVRTSLLSLDGALEFVRALRVMMTDDTACVMHVENNLDGATMMIDT